MNRTMWLLAVAGVCGTCGVLGVTASASGQEVRPAGKAPAQGGVFSEEPLARALAASIEQNRVLIVVVSNDKAKQAANAAPWNDPHLAAWARAHALVVHVTDMSTIRTLTAGGLKPGGPEQPLIFRGGKQQRLFGSDPRANTNRLRPTPKEGRRPGDEASNAALRLMLRLEWTRRGWQKEDPAWWTAHNAACPAPTFSPGTLHTQSSPGALAMAQVPAVQGVEGVAADQSDALGRWLQAEALMAREDEESKRAAAGIMTWLWEAGPSADPVVGPTIQTMLPGRMRKLAERWPAAAERWEELRQAGLDRLAWMDHRELFAFLMLARVVDRHVDVLDLMDAALDDSDGAMLLPAADRLSWELILPRAALGDPLKLPGTGEPKAFLERLLKRIKGEPPKRLAQDQWTSAVRFQGVMLVNEGCRLHAALLAAGRDEEARGLTGAMKDLFGERGPEAVLTAAALASGQARPFHAEWMDQSKDPAAKRLGAYVRASLAAQKTNAPAGGG
jgi:hypothetical protein